MRDEYDFKKMKGQANPHARALKMPITIRLDRETVNYFKAMSGEVGLPYQNLINLYLRDCASHHRKLRLAWGTGGG